MTESRRDEENDAVAERLVMDVGGAVVGGDDDAVESAIYILFLGVGLGGGIGGGEGGGRDGKRAENRKKRLD